MCVTDGDRMLLVEHEKHGRRYWLVPGGGVELGETLHESAAREVLEETGFHVEIGPLQVLCEAIDPGGRHIVNVVYAGRLLGGSLRVGHDAALRDVAWQPREAIAQLTIYPPIGAELLACWDEGFRGRLRELGNVWR